MDYSAANAGLWGFVIQFGLIAGAILLAQFLYRVVKPLRRPCCPSPCWRVFCCWRQKTSASRWTMK
jgi:hypothetical protein